MRPIMVSTWSFGMKANGAGWPILRRGGSSLDAVEQACRIVEEDPAIDSVGKGGLPDDSGEVSLDASIMLSPDKCGGVCFVRRFEHPITMARGVMEKTSHILLAGEGADAFGAHLGLPRTDDLLMPDAKALWQAWCKDPSVLCVDDGRFRGWMPPRNVEELQGIHPAKTRRVDVDVDAEENRLPNRFHDTVGVLALDQAGVMAGACSTSGMAFKVPGRVGDSPIIGHALYVDPRYGAAVTTGSGELFMRVCGAFLAVEQLRHDPSGDPRKAARAVIERIMESCALREEHQACIIVMTPDGQTAGAALRPGFRIAIRTEDRSELIDADEVLIPESEKEPRTEGVSDAFKEPRTK